MAKNIADFENYYSAIVSVLPGVAMKSRHHFTYNPADPSMASKKQDKRIRAIKDRVPAVMLPNYYRSTKMKRSEIPSSKGRRCVCAYFALCRDVLICQHETNNTLIYGCSLMYLAWVFLVSKHSIAHSDLCT